MRPAPLGRVAAVARRDVLIQLSYQFQLITLFTSAIFAAFLAYYVSDLVGSADAIDRFDGSYYDYVVVGIALTSYASLGVSAFARQITVEQAAGTVEVLLSSAARYSELLFGGMVVPFALTTVEVGLLLGVGIGVVGIGLSVGAVAAALPLLAVTIMCFCAMGIASAALILLAKRGDPISGPLFQLTLVMSGAIFPIELLPRWAEVLCRATPAYYAVRGTREALLTDGGLRATLDELVIVSAFAAVLLPLSVWLFGRAVSHAKRLGVLSSY